MLVTIVHVHRKEARVVKLACANNTIKETMLVGKIVVDFSKCLLALDIKEGLVCKHDVRLREVGRRMLVKLVELRIAILVSSV